jgi:hypothetical protein
LGSSKLHFSFLKKKPETVPFLTALFSFSPANAETGEKKIFEKFSRYSSPLSFPSHLHKTHTYKPMPP